MVLLRLRSWSQLAASRAIWSLSMGKIADTEENITTDERKMLAATLGLSMTETPAGLDRAKPTISLAANDPVTRLSNKANPRPGRTGGRRKMNQLSNKQQRMLEFIERFIEENNGLPPTVREIQMALNISSTSVVDYNLAALEQKGFITRTEGKSRAISLKNRPKGSRTEEVPLLGVIAAGTPIPDRKDVSPEDVVEIPPFMLGGRRGNDVYALRVKGQSMVDALIADGDIVLIKPQETAEVGEIVAVWLERERETTLKKWYPDQTRNQVRLQPANQTMEPIYTELSNTRIMGKLVGVIRTTV
jgi:repressor LexA